MKENTEIDFGLGKTAKLLIVAVVAFSLAIVFAFLFVILLRYLWCQTGLDNLCNDVYSIEKNSILIRNYLFGVGAIIGLKFAYDRLRIADNKLKSDDGAAIQQTYYEAAKLLGDSSVSARMAGIFELIKLKNRRPDQFAVPVLDILAGFIVHSVPKFRLVDNKLLSDEMRVDNLEDFDNLDNPYVMNYEAENAFIAICNRNKEDIEMYSSKMSERRLDLQRAKLSNIEVLGGNLSSIAFSFSELASSEFFQTNFTESVFSYAKLKETSLIECVCIEASFDYADMESVELLLTNFKNAKFEEAKLKDAVFTEANVAGADFTNADLCNVDLSEALGLTQEQLDVACQSPGPEPSLGKGFKWNKPAAIKRWRKVRAQYSSASTRPRTPSAASQTGR